jgi:hypothetical protein
MPGEELEVREAADLDELPRPFRCAPAPHSLQRNARRCNETEKTSQSFIVQKLNWVSANTSRTVLCQYIRPCNATVTRKKTSCNARELNPLQENGNEPA